MDTVSHVDQQMLEVGHVIPLFDLEVDKEHMISANEHGVNVEALDKPMVCIHMEENFSPAGNAVFLQAIDVLGHALGQAVTCLMMKMVLEALCEVYGYIHRLTQQIDTYVIDAKQFEECYGATGNVDKEICSYDDLRVEVDGQAKSCIYALFSWMTGKKACSQQQGYACEVGVQVAHFRQENVLKGTTFDEVLKAGEKKHFDGYVIMVWDPGGPNLCF